MKGVENQTVASWHSVEGAVVREEEGETLPFDGDLGGTCYSSRGEQSFETYCVLGGDVGGSRDDGYSRNGFLSVRWSDP